MKGANILDWELLFDKMFEKRQNYKTAMAKNMEVEVDDSKVRRSHEIYNLSTRHIETNVQPETVLRLKASTDTERISKDSFIDEKINNKVPVYKWSALFNDGIMDYDLYNIDSLILAIGKKRGMEKTFEVVKAKNKKAFTNEIEKSASFIRWEEKLKLRKIN